MPRSHKCSLSSVCISYSSHSCYMPRPSHRPWSHHANNTWRRIQMMSLLVM